MEIWGFFLKRINYDNVKLVGTQKDSQAFIRCAYSESKARHGHAFPDENSITSNTHLPYVS